MGKSVKVIPKKRGRPATGKDPIVPVRMPPAVTEAIEAWADEHGVSRSEAMRRLLEEALATQPKAKREK